MISNICSLLLSCELVSNEASAAEMVNAHRNLALAEWLVKMEKRRTEMDDSNQYGVRVGVLTWLVEQGKEKLSNLEESFSRQSNALSAVPSASVRNSKGFGYYLDLPGRIVRERVLSFVKDPQDLLNMLEAFPDEAKYSNRTKAALQFEIEFPQMIRNGTLSWDGDGNTDNIHRLRAFASESEHHQKVILFEFQNYLVGNITDKSRFDEGSVQLDFFDLQYWGMEDKKFKEWVKFPEIRQVHANGTYRRNGNCLKKAGLTVWDFQISFNEALNLEYTWKNLCWYLGFLPNLRNLCVVFDEVFIQDQLADLEDYGWESLALPDLPCLKSIKLDGWNEPNLFPISKLLFEKYGGQLNLLQFEIVHELTEDSLELPPCPNLTILTIDDMNMFNEPETNSEIASRLLLNFNTAPLKMLKLNLTGPSMRTALYQTMDHVSKYFGSTLEHLEVNFGWALSVSVDNESPPPSHTLLNVRLPKLKHFETNIDPRPDGWGFLLLFPSLEFLRIHRRRGQENDGNEAFDNMDTVKTSKLWEWLTSLQVIELEVMDREKVSVTRDEALVAQLNQ